MKSSPALVYVHGLNSSSQSVKATLLRETLAPLEVAAVDYPAHRPDAAIKTLSAYFSSLVGEPPAVIGSSMGGFYSQYLARRFRFSHLFMINPALTPWDLLGGRVGELQTTAQGETYELTLALLDQTRQFGIPDPCDDIPTTVFLDRGDEVIDYRVAERIYSTCGQLLIWDDGDHAFQHMDEAIAVIRAHLVTR